MTETQWNSSESYDASGYPGDHYHNAFLVPELTFAFVWLVQLKLIIEKTLKKLNLERTRAGPDAGSRNFFNQYLSHDKVCLKVLPCLIPIDTS